MQLSINQKKNYFSLQNQQVPENFILVFGFYKLEKKG